MSIVVYGIGSPITLDVAETCLRLRLPVAAWIRNIEGPVFVPDGADAVDAAQLAPTLLKYKFLVALFTPGHRHSAAAQARQRGLRDAATVIDPTALVASSAEIASGSYVNSMVNIAAKCRIGEFAFINRNASIGHHAELSEFVSIGPGAVIAGNVQIARGALIGAGAVVTPNMHIGANAVVNAGAVVTEAVPPQTIVAGNPAQIVKRDIAGYHGVSVT